MRSCSHSFFEMLCIWSSSAILGALVAIGLFRLVCWVRVRVALSSITYLVVA